MKKLALILVTTLVIVTSFTSCKDDCPVDKPTKTELLTANEWIGDEAVIYVNDVEGEITSISDFKMAFLTNFDVINYNDNQPDELYKWRFINNEQSFKFIDYNDATEETLFDIDTLNETNFVFSMTEVDGDDTVKIVYKFTH